MTVYRLVQEAITNIAKYAKAKQVWVQLAAHAGQVQVSWKPGHGIQDQAGTPNAFAGGNWNYTVDPNAPPMARSNWRDVLKSVGTIPEVTSAQPISRGIVVAERGSPSHEVLVRHLSRGNSGWVPRASLVLVVGALLWLLAGIAPRQPPKKRDWNWRSQYVRGLVYQVLALAAIARPCAANLSQAGWDRSKARTLWPAF